MTALWGGLKYARYRDRILINAAQVMLLRTNLNDLDNSLLLSLLRRRTLQARPSPASPGLPWGIVKNWQFSA
jgi:hypothetical protein